MELEDKAKVVVSVWGAECVQFLAALAVLPRSIWKKRMNLTVSSRSTEAKQWTRQEIQQILPPNRRDDLCLVFLFHPSSMVLRDCRSVQRRQRPSPPPEAKLNFKIVVWPAPSRSTCCASLPSVLAEIQELLVQKKDNITSIKSVKSQHVIVRSTFKRT